MNQKKVYADSWRDAKREWKDFVKYDVFCTAFSYARYCETMEEISGFGMKDCLGLPTLGWK